MPPLPPGARDPERLSPAERVLKEIGPPPIILPPPQRQLMRAPEATNNLETDNLESENLETATRLPTGKQSRTNAAKTTKLTASANNENKKNKKNQQ